MLDHVFTDALAALRDVLENALLEPQVIEERLHADVLAGDLTWQTAYSLPGEGNPPRVQADLTLEWSTWSQASYRSWRMGEPPGEAPRIGIEIVLRVQRLRAAPDPEMVLAVVPASTVEVGPVQLERTGPRIEAAWDGVLPQPEHAIELSYEGSFELDEATLADASHFDGHFSAMGGWIASTLVRLADLDLDFLPPDEEENAE